MDSRDIAGLALEFILELLERMVFLETALKSNYLVLIVNFKVLSGAVFEIFIASWVVLLSNHVGVPFDDQMAVPEELWNPRLSWFNDASTTLLDPVAFATVVTLSIYILEDKWL